MPQPLSRVRPDAEISIGGKGDDPSTQRPQIAVLAMRVLADWSILDTYMSSIFVRLLGANPAPGAAMYASLSGGNARRDAFRAVIARAGLDEDETDILDAIFALLGSSAKERNAIAHGAWGYCRELPDAVLICEPEVFMEEHIALEAWFQSGKNTPIPDFDRERIRVYYAHDFESQSNKIRRLMDFAGKYHLMLFLARGPYREIRVPATADELRAQLLQEPEISEYVTRQRNSRRNNLK